MLHGPFCRAIRSHLSSGAARAVVLAAAAVLALAVDANAQSLTADYRFDGTRASSVGSAPALTDLGANTFATETVDGVSRTVLRFGHNNGLSLSPTADVMPSGRYTIVMLFRFDEVDGFRRTVDFRNGASDTAGAYIEDGRLKHSNDPPNIEPDEWVQVVYTRDGSITSQRGYVDGVLSLDGREDPVFDFALVGTTLRFFRDDNEFPNEASSGAVARIRIYNAQLSESQVALLDQLPGAGADVAIVHEGLAAQAGSGSLYLFAARVSNTSPSETASGVEVRMSTPIGTTFALATATQGVVAGPSIGEEGEVVAAVGSLAPGTSALVSVILNVTASPGQSITGTTTVTSIDGDSDPSNNLATTTVPVVASGNAMLTWEPPPPPGGNVLLPPPQRLVVQSTAPFVDGRPAGAANLLGYNVYRSNRPGVLPSPGALLVSVTTGQTSVDAPVAPGGTFFVVTGVYDDGESAPSNEGSAGIAAGSIGRLKVTASKITVVGLDFTDEVSVFVDGIPFQSPAIVKKNNTKVVQKGRLITGQTVGQYLAAYPAVLISIRNSNGGIVSRRYPE